MSKKRNLVFNENVERITMALDKAVPKGSKSSEVVYALCILLANIFMNRTQENVSKDEYLFTLTQIIIGLIEENENN